MTKTEKGYEPSSLQGILSSIECHVSHASYGKAIFKDSELKKKLANKTSSSDVVAETDQMPQQLLLTRKSKFCMIEKKLLGLSSPQPPLNIMWLSNTIHFGLRGCKEHKELRWGGHRS